MDKQLSVSYHPETSVGDGAQLWQLTLYPQTPIRQAPPTSGASRLLLPISKEAVLGLVQLQEKGLMPSRETDLTPLAKERGKGMLL